MDPITLILTTLVTGAAAAFKPTAEQAVKDAYAGLKTLLQHKFAGKPAAEVALTEYEKKPDIWKAPLEAAIKETGTDQDQKIIAAAEKLAQLARELQGAKISTFQASSSGDYSPVTQTGDHSPVTQTFNQYQYFDKAGRDWNVRLTPASELKLESFKLGNPTAATYHYVLAPIEEVFAAALEALRAASERSSNARCGLLIFGEANAGKTRLAVEALRAALPSWPVLRWKPDSTKDDIPPVEFLQGKYLVLFVDDLQDYVSAQESTEEDVNYRLALDIESRAQKLSTLVETLTQATQRIILVVTCRTENTELVQKHLAWLFNLLLNITVPSFDIGDPDILPIIDEFKSYGSVYIEDWDGTLGSLVLGLSIKESQYKNLPPSAKTVLQAMKLLNWVYPQAQAERHLRATCASLFGKKGFLDDDVLWQEALGHLTRTMFVKEETDRESWESIFIIRKDAYFERVVTDYPQIHRSHQLERDLVRLRKVFRDLQDIPALLYLTDTFADMWTEAGDMRKEALITIDAAITLDPTKAENWRYKAWLKFAQRGGYWEEPSTWCKEVLDSLDHALDLDPNHAGCWNLKASILQLLQRHEEAIVPINRSLDLDPNDAHVWQKKGESLANLQRHEEALIAFDRSLEIEPGDQRDDSDLWIGNRAWYYKGLSLTLLKRYEEALVAFEHDRKHHRGPWDLNNIEYEFFTDHCTSRLSSPENQRHISYGGTLNILSRYENGPYLRDEKVQKECKKLLARIDQVLVVDPDDVKLWHLRGLVLYLMERYEEAIAAFNSALTFHSNFLDAWYLKGVSLCMLKRYEEALDAFDHGWAPGNQDSVVRFHLFMFSREEWAWYLKGVSLEKVRGREQALAAFEHVADMFMRHYRQHPHPYLVSNDGFFQRGSFRGQQKLDEKLAEQNDSVVIDQIIDLYLASTDRIVALYPDDILVWYYKGVTLYLMERYEEALVAFDRTLELDPHYIDAWLSKGYAFAALGQHNEKAEAFCHVPNMISQRFKGYSLSIWQRYLGAFDRSTRMHDPGDVEAWVVDLYELVRQDHIRDPQIIREIANRFEALANDVEAAVKVRFDLGRAAQNLHKRADLLESLNIPFFDDEGEAQWSEDSASSDRFWTGG